ncbi:MAG TPA: hypothetical protein PLF13_14285 [candidate division Zixibacteria bacterium]|nr:hypothetical protein [candidate division Zixibacteria bacterium]
MSTFVKLCAANAKKYSPIDAAAYFFAEPGAQGSNGEIVIVSRSGEKYSCNFIYGDMPLDCYASLCPPLNDTKFNIGGQRDLPPNGWQPLYLGLGNHLIVSDDYADSFAKELAAQSIMNRGQVYQHWLSIMVGIILGKDSKAYLETEDFPTECHKNYDPKQHGKRNPAIERNLDKMFAGPFSIVDLLCE